MIDRHEEGICGVCARRDAGMGIGEWKRRSQMLWVCNDPDCLKIAKATQNMKQDEFSRIESLAAGRGGAEAGAFLEQIGKTDLAQLNHAEWFEFCRRLIASYRKALKAELGGGLRG